MTKEEERAAAKLFLAKIRGDTEAIGRKLRIMEVCGTHTVAIFRTGLRPLLADSVELVSGPGCPVCVTPNDYVDKAITYAERSDVVIATFGDMLKVNGAKGNLSDIRAKGAEVRVVYSPLDSLAIARDNPDKKIIFLAVGFETTAPAAAGAVLQAKSDGIKNLFMLSAQKLVPPVMRALLDSGDIRVDGFLLPGHVAVVTGAEYFDFLAEEYQLSGVVGGFNAVQLLRAIARLAKLIRAGESAVLNEYESVVKPHGNATARRIMYEVYEPAAANWRGMGEVSHSGLELREEFSEYDIERALPLAVNFDSAMPSGCSCGAVLRGQVNPRECRLFGRACTPEHAVGPCMVSVEGVCAAWYKYGGGNFAYARAE